MYTSSPTKCCCIVVPLAPLVNALNTLPFLLPYNINSLPIHILPGTFNVGCGKKLALATVMLSSYTSTFAVIVVVLFVNILK